MSIVAEAKVRLKEERAPYIHDWLINDRVAFVIIHKHELQGSQLTLTFEADTDNEAHRVEQYLTRLYGVEQVLIRWPVTQDP